MATGSTIWRSRRVAFCASIASGLLLWIYFLPGTSLLATGVESPLEVVTEPAVLRTIVVASVSALVCVTLGVALGSWLLPLMPTHLFGALAALLLVPALMGDLVVGAMVKMLLVTTDGVPTAVRDRDETATSIALVAVNTWQYAPMCVYLVWLRLSTCRRKLLDFVSSMDLLPAELTRDVLWPRCRSLSTVLVVMIVLLVASDYSKPETILGASEGTDTSQATHWLYEQHRQWRLTDRNLAASVALGRSIPLMGVILALSIVLAFVTWRYGAHPTRALQAVTARVSRLRRDGRSTAAGRQSRMYRRYGMVGLFAMMSLAPFAALIIMVPTELPSNTERLPLAVLLSVLCGVVSGTWAILLALLWRMGLRTSSKVGRWKSALVPVLAVAVKAVPPLIVVVGGYEWFSSFAGNGPLAGLGARVFGQSILTVPFLFLFASWLHTRVSDREIEFQHLVRPGLRAPSAHSFFSRLRVDYGLVFLFATMFCWNEGVIAAMVSDDWPSLASTLQRQIGRRADFGQATGAICFTVFLCLIGVAWWTLMLRRSMTRTDEE